MDNRSHYRVFFVAALLAAATVVADHGWTQTKLPRLGILTNGTAEDPYVGGLRWEGIVSALAKLGWIEGQNIEFDIRSAAGDLTRFAELAADLVKAKPDVIWADSAPALRAAYAATHTIPILARDFTNDPVAAGYAENYYRPGKNVTGVFMDAPQFAVKWIELLRAIIPELASIAVLWDPSPGDAHLRALEQVAPGLGIELQVIEVHSPEDIDVAASAIKTGSQALITLPSPLMRDENRKFVRLAKRSQLPSISIFPFFADAGGLIAYGPERDSFNTQAAAIASKLLRGADPGELPMERIHVFELVVNLKTARALGLAMPSDIMVRADRIIE